MATVFVFGNGIGMAIDSDRFSLDCALKKHYEKLDGGTTQLIHNLIGRIGAPRTEDDLRNVQRFLTYYNNDEGADQIKSYLANVTKEFFDANSDDFRSTKLCQSFCSYIKSAPNGSVHVATLNYDKL